jgi:thiamine-monophosphate kinase
MTKQRRDEFGLISYLTGKQTVPPDLKTRIAVGNGDDAAVFSGRSGYDMIACCDTMVEDVHFKRQTMQPYDIGYKALASNISDIAAMGGIPLFYLVSLGLSPAWEEEEVAEMYRGMAELAAFHHMALLGGDTVATNGPLTLTVTVLGETEKNTALLRSNARPGDLVFVTGTVGNSGAGLHVLLQEKWGVHNIPPQWELLTNCHRQPKPQVEAGRLLSQSGLRVALNDISDGLASEAWELAEASGVTIVLDEVAIPLSDCIKEYARISGKHAVEWALYGGEDYQLIGCVPAKGKDALSDLFVEHKLPLYWIGEVQDGDVQVQIRKMDGSVTSLPKKGYNHFNGQ